MQQVTPDHVKRAWWVEREAAAARFMCAMDGLNAAQSSRSEILKLCAVASSAKDTAGVAACNAALVAIGGVICHFSRLLEVGKQVNR